MTSLDGRVHAVDLETGTTSVVLDISDRVSDGGERGLLGIAIDPEGERMYLDFTNRRGDTEIRSWPLGANGLPEAGEGTLHLEIGQPFENHNGGNLVFGPDGALWIGTGDGGGAGDRGEVAQDDSYLLGKMLRVTRTRRWGARSQVERQLGTSGGLGHRAAQPVALLLRPCDEPAVDRRRRPEHDRRGVRRRPDAERPNFGWDTVEGANDYEGEPSREFTAPVVTYDHDDGCSITGGYVYRGDELPSLYGWYLFADYCTGFIKAVPADDPTDEPTVLALDIGNVISFGELDDGELVVLTSSGIQRLLSP